MPLSKSDQSIELRFVSKRFGTAIRFSPEVVEHFARHRQQGKVKTEIGGQLFAQGCIKLGSTAPGLRNPNVRDPKSETNPKPEPRRSASIHRPAWIFDGPFGLRPSGLFRISGFGFRAFVQAQQGLARRLDAALLFARFERGDVRVVRATGPNPADKRGWTWFRPDLRRQNIEIQQLFQEGLHFIGDWHTHPEREPTPSSWDTDSMMDSFKKSRHQLRAFLMVIVGRADFPSGLWVSLHQGDVVERLIFDYSSVD